MIGPEEVTYITHGGGGGDFIRSAETHGAGGVGVSL